MKRPKDWSKYDNGSTTNKENLDRETGIKRHKKQDLTMNRTQVEMIVRAIIWIAFIAIWAYISLRTGAFSQHYQVSLE